MSLIINMHLSYIKIHYMLEQAFKILINYIYTTKIVNMYIIKLYTLVKLLNNVSPNMNSAYRLLYY